MLSQGVRSGEAAGATTALQRRAQRTTAIVKQLIDVRQLGIIFRTISFLSSIHHFTHAVLCALLCAHAYRRRIGACNPMLCPIYVFRL